MKKNIKGLLLLIGNEISKSTLFFVSSLKNMKKMVQTNRFSTAREKRGFQPWITTFTFILSIRTRSN